MTTLDDLTDEELKEAAVRGTALGSHVEVVDVEYDRPPTGDQKRIVEATALLVDKIQLLTGEATSRPELLGGAEPAQRAQLVGVVADLAERAKVA